MTQITVTCTTPGCWNEGIPIQVESADEVGCGGCHTRIQLEEESHDETDFTGS